MVHNRYCRMATLVVLGSVLVAGGCVVATDLLNPSLLTGLGFDPQTVIPPQGRVVVAFQNQTAFNATFASSFSREPFGQDANFELLQAEDVGPDETRNSVIDCPVAVISPFPGIDDFGATTTGVSVAVAAAEGVVAVSYFGSALELTKDYVCGDVIVIRLIQTGAAGGDNDFRIQVERLPGR